MGIVSIGMRPAVFLAGFGAAAGVDTGLLAEEVAAEHLAPSAGLGAPTSAFIPAALADASSSRASAEWGAGSSVGPSARRPAPQMLMAGSRSSGSSGRTDDSREEDLERIEYLMDEAIYHEGRGRYQEAIELFREVIQIDPTYVLALMHERELAGKLERTGQCPAERSKVRRVNLEEALHSLYGMREIGSGRRVLPGWANELLRKAKKR